MTGDKNYLKEVNPYTNNYARFCDWAKGKIVGKWKLVYPGLPNFEDVLLVEKLTASLISIIQLCDQDLYVNFTRFI